MDSTEASFSVAPSVEPTKVTIRFDAAGPYIGFETDNVQKKTSGVLAVKPAALQKNIYMRGQRYWRKWARCEDAAEKFTTKQTVQIGVLLLVACAATYYVARHTKSR